MVGPLICPALAPVPKTAVATAPVPEPTEPKLIVGAVVYPTPNTDVVKLVIIPVGLIAAVASAPTATKPVTEPPEPPPETTNGVRLKALPLVKPVP